MIVVGVALDTVSQIEAHLITRNKRDNVALLEGVSGVIVMWRLPPKKGIRLVFVGPPGAGKGDAGAVPHSVPGIPQIPDHDMLRAAKKGARSRLRSRRP